MAEDLSILTNADWQQRLQFLRRCAETRPADHVFTEAVNVAQFVQDAACAILNGLTDGGLKAPVGAQFRALEADIYAHIRRSNADRVVFSTMEYWGQHIDGPDGPAMRDRVLTGISMLAADRMDVQVREEGLDDG